jgi:hypothetical protein
MEAEIYTKSDTLNTLTPEQLDLMAKTDRNILLHYLEKNTIFDVHRIRLMLELAASEAAKRLHALGSNTEVVRPEGCERTQS